jgi:hypothetical protein
MEQYEREKKLNGEVKEIVLYVHIVDSKSFDKDFDTDSDSSLDSE